LRHFRRHHQVYSSLYRLLDLFAAQISPNNISPTSTFFSMTLSKALSFCHITCHYTPFQFFPAHCPISATRHQAFGVLIYESYIDQWPPQQISLVEALTRRRNRSMLFRAYLRGHHWWYCVPGDQQHFGFEFFRSGSHQRGDVCCSP
jgi:hypothetical protein